MTFWFGYFYVFTKATNAYFLCIVRNVIINIKSFRHIYFQNIINNIVNNLFSNIAPFSMAKCKDEKVTEQKCTELKLWKDGFPNWQGKCRKIVSFISPERMNFFKKKFSSNHSAEKNWDISFGPCLAYSLKNEITLYENIYFT